MNTYIYFRGATIDPADERVAVLADPRAPAGISFRRRPVVARARCIGLAAGVTASALRAQDTRA